MKRMEEPGVVTGGPAEAPEKTEAEVTQQEALARSDDRGGVRIEKAVVGSPTPVDDASILMQEAVRKDLNEKMDTAPAKTEVKEKPLDISLIKSQIETLKAKKPGFFDFGRTKDTIDLLGTALRKIQGDSGYAKHYMAALEHGEDFALEYAKDIGAGKLLKPVDGVLMTTDKRHGDKFIG
jgi:hypothetical protein